MSQGTKVEGGWVGKDAIRGQESSSFWASDGPKRGPARATTFISCGGCGRGLKKRDGNRDGPITYPKVCDHCQYVNDPPRTV